MIQAMNITSKDPPCTETDLRTTPLISFLLTIGNKQSRPATHRTYYSSNDSARKGTDELENRRRSESDRI